MCASDDYLLHGSLLMGDDSDLLVDVLVCLMCLVGLVGVFDLVSLTGLVTCVVVAYYADHVDLGRFASLVRCVDSVGLIGALYIIAFGESLEPLGGSPDQTFVYLLQRLEVFELGNIVGQFAQV